MALATRIIPTLLCRGRTLVKGKQFMAWRSVGVAAQAVRIHQARGVDELVLLDIAATPEGRGPDLALVDELTADCFMPLAVGGGVRTVEDVRALLRAGADKVVIGTAAFERPDIINEIADKVGSQSLVVALDVTHDRIAIRGGRDVLDTMPTPEGIAGQARAAAERGAGEILLTACDREGEMRGYDTELVRAVASAVSIPVVAHGGCGHPSHMLEAIQAGASAVAAGSMFLFTDETPRSAARYLAAAGVEVRQP